MIQITRVSVPLYRVTMAGVAPVCHHHPENDKINPLFYKLVSCSHLHNMGKSIQLPPAGIFLITVQILKLQNTNLTMPNSEETMGK